MPKVTEDNQAYPPWCELERYTIRTLAAGEDATLAWTAPRFKLVWVRGAGLLRTGPEVALPERAVWDAPDDGRRSVTVHAAEPSTLVALEGAWGAETGGSGVFSVVHAEAPVNRGDPVDYERSTSFDNHYHDCDEYWIITEGEGTAVSEGVAVAVGPGDCIVTGAGDHHDFPAVTVPVRAVFFETTLLGQKRTGHLWEHTHGPAHPIRH